MVIIKIDCVSVVRRVISREAVDLVLSHVVTKARESLRPSDLLFRYDADRIVAVLTGTERQRAIEIAALITDGFRTPNRPRRSLNSA